MQRELDKRVSHQVGGRLQKVSGGLSGSTVGKWVTITSEMRFYGFRCLLSMVFRCSNWSGSSEKYSVMTL